MAGRELWPNAALLPSSVFCSLLTGAHAWYCTALCSQPGIAIASSYCSVPQGPWRLTVAAGVPHSTKEFAKELCCCYKYWLLASVSSSLYLETMEESWPAGCPVGRGALSMLSTLLLSEPLLKCQPAILPSSGGFYSVQEG